MRRFAPLLLLTIASCYAGFESQLRHAAATDHSCPMEDTGIVRDLAENTWLLEVCGVGRVYSHIGNGEFVEERGGPFSGQPTRPAYGNTRYGGSGSVHVRGYHRRDGTYVRPHSRRRPR